MLPGTKHGTCNWRLQRTSTADAHLRFLAACVEVQASARTSTRRAVDLAMISAHTEGIYQDRCSSTAEGESAVA